MGDGHLNKTTRNSRGVGGHMSPKSFFEDAFADTPNVELVMIPEHFTSRVLVERDTSDTSDTHVQSMLSTVVTLRPPLRKSYGEWRRNVDQLAVVQRDPTPPPNNMYTRASLFNSFALGDSEPLDDPVKTLLFARGHCVERFAVDALRDNCQEEEQTMVEEGQFVSDDALHLCGTPDAIVSHGSERVLIEVKSTTKEVDISMSLEWVLQCHVYMILTDTHKARIIVKQHKAWSPSCPAGWRMLRVNMNPDIKTLLETSHEMVPEERVKHVLAEAKNLQWQACVSEVPTEDDNDNHDFITRAMRSAAAFDVHKLRAAIGATCAAALKMKKNLRPKLRFDDLQGLEKSFYYKVRGKKHAGGNKGSEKLSRHVFVGRDPLAGAGIAFSGVEMATKPSNHVQVEIKCRDTTSIAGHLLTSPLAPHARASNHDMSRFDSATLNVACGGIRYQLMKSLGAGAGDEEMAKDFRNGHFIVTARHGEGQVSSSSDEAMAADTETNLTSGGRRRINNGTVSKAVSSVKRPRRMKRKATAMWRRRSSRRS